MAGGERDEVGEAFEGDDVGVLHVALDGFGQLDELTHQPSSPGSEFDGVDRGFAVGDHLRDPARTVLPHQEHGTLGGIALVADIGRHAATSPAFIVTRARLAPVSPSSTSH